MKTKEQILNKNLGVSDTARVEPFDTCYRKQVLSAMEELEQQFTLSWDVPFSVDLLWNGEVQPSEGMKKWMGDMYETHVKDWQEKENKVWFSNTQVSYDSCDCGDGYGCPHGSWPFEINFANNDKKCIGEFEDENSLVLTGVNNSIHIDDYTKITMRQFINLCELVGIKLEYKPDFGAAALPVQGHSREDMEKAINRTFDMCGYGFVGRVELTDKIIAAIAGYNAASLPAAAHMLPNQSIT